MLRWLNALESKLNTSETGKRLPEEALLGNWNILTAGNKRVASCLLRDWAFYMIWGLSSDWSRILKNLWKKNKSSLNKWVVVCHPRPALVSRLHLPSQGLVSDQPFWLMWSTCRSRSPCIPNTLQKISVAESILWCCCDVAAHCAWGPPCFFPATCFRVSVAVEDGGFILCVAMLLLDGRANVC